MKQIEEHLAEALGSDVTLKRKSAAKSLLMLIAGIAIIVASAKVPALSSGYINSTMIFVGGLLALVGLLMGLSAFLSKEFYYIPEKSRLSKKVEFFDIAEEGNVKKLVESGSINGLEELRKSTAPTLQLIMYRTSKGKVVAAQLQKYIPYTYHPVTDIVVMH